jgi:16S rRNA (uracil1498-N3)-methyltransferase
MTAARSAAAHVFVVDLDRPEPDDDDWYHLQRVLRLRPGESVTAADGRGRWRVCRMAAEAQRLEPDAPVVEEPHPSPLVAVGFAPVKGDRPEWTVQKLTELGVDLIVPFTAARSVVRWDAERREHHLRRLRRVAREAAMQARRAWLPEVAELTDLAGATRGMRTAGANGPDAVALAEPGGGPLTDASRAVLVGPEGGWTPEELGSGLPTVGLSATILRAETAAVAVGTLLCALREGRVAPRDRRST